MAGVLTLGQWLGGPDNVKVESTFPTSQKTYSYNFDQNITGWTFQLDYQTVVVDTITYDRNGEPNFATSKVVGYFPPGTVSTSSYIAVTSVGGGTVNVTHPKGLYPDANGILPDSRANVPLLVMGLNWTDASTPPVTTIHRIAKILAWEPGVLPVDPTSLTNTNFISIV